MAVSFRAFLYLQMKKIYFPGYVLFILPVIIVSCNNSPAKKKTEAGRPEIIKQDRHKPPANYQDTLKIDFPAAVFYHPDSLQLLKIKEVTDTMVFDGSMHEYEYLMKNARATIRSVNPGLKIIEAKNKRYLLFIKSDNSSDCIDLNTSDDAYGLFVFDRIKPPSLLDMANIDRGLWFYFSEKIPEPRKK